VIATRQQVLVGLFLGALAACSSPEPTGEDVHRGVEGAGEETGLEVPVLTVSSPARGAFVGTDPVTVEGHVSEGSAPISSVTVGDMSAIVEADGAFSATLNPSPGLHIVNLRATAEDAGRAVDGRAFIAGPVHDPGDTIEGGVQLQLSPELLDDDDPDVDDVATLAEMLLEDPSITSSFEGVPLETDDFIITPTSLEFGGADVDLTVGDDRLYATVALQDLWLDFGAEGNTWYYSWVSTTGSAWADAVYLDIELAVSGSDGEVRLTPVETVAVFDGFGITVDGFPDSLEGWLADWVQDTLEEEISITAEELVGDLIGEYLDAFAVDFEVFDGVQLGMALAGATADDAGLVLELDATVASSTTGVSMPDGAGSVATTGRGPTLPVQTDAPFVVAADDDVVNQLFFALWQAGALEGIEFSGLELGGLAGAEIPAPLGPVEMVSVSLGLPPVISPGTVEDFPATFSMGELRMVFDREDGVRFDFSVNAAAGMEVSFEDDGELGLVLDNRPSAMEVAVGVEDCPDVLDPGDLAALLRLMVPPLFGNASLFMPSFPPPSIALGELTDFDAFEGQELSFADPDLEMADDGWVLLSGRLTAE